MRPRTNGILGEPAPEGRVADRGDQAPSDSLATNVWNAQPREGKLVFMGSSQASALTATTTLGGKASRPPAARSLLQANEALLEEALAPLADDLPRRIEPKGNLVVAEPRAA